MQDTLPRPTALPTSSPATARAAVLVKPGRVEVRDVPVPEPGPGQVRLRLEGCGVCASNVPVWEGRPWFGYPLEPGAPGHEGWGVVEALGPDVAGVEEGDRVAAITYHAFATHDLADAADLVSIPDALDGRPFPGEPLGCAVNIFRRSQIEAGQTVAIVGAGFLGALLTQLAKAEGARIIALSRRDFSLDTARTAGADETIQLQEDRGPLVEQVFEMTNGEGCEVVIEATGKQAPLDLAAELTRVRGRLVIAGYHQDGMREVNMQLWNWRGLDVINAHERDPAVYADGMRRAAAAVADGRLDPAPLYTHTFALDELGEALEAARTRPDGFLKALIRTTKASDA